VHGAENSGKNFAEVRYGSGGDLLESTMESIRKIVGEYDLFQVNLIHIFQIPL
jgi:hypothetical protein